MHILTRSRANASSPAGGVHRRRSAPRRATACSASRPGAAWSRWPGAWVIKGGEGRRLPGLVGRNPSGPRSGTSWRWPLIRRGRLATGPGRRRLQHTAVMAFIDGIPETCTSTTSSPAMPSSPTARPRKKGPTPWAWDFHVLGYTIAASQQTPYRAVLRRPRRHGTWGRRRFRPAGRRTASSVERDEHLGTPGESGQALGRRDRPAGWIVLAIFGLLRPGSVCRASSCLALAVHRSSPRPCSSSTPQRRRPPYRDGQLARGGASPSRPAPSASPSDAHPSGGVLRPGRAARQLLGEPSQNRETLWDCWLRQAKRRHSSRRRLAARGESAADGRPMRRTV